MGTGGPSVAVGAFRSPGKWRQLNGRRTAARRVGCRGIGSWRWIGNLVGPVGASRPRRATRRRRRDLLEWVTAAVVDQPSAGPLRDAQRLGVASVGQAPAPLRPFGRRFDSRLGVPRAPGRHGLAAGRPGGRGPTVTSVDFQSADRGAGAGGPPRCHRTGSRSRRPRADPQTRHASRRRRTRRVHAGRTRDGASRRASVLRFAGRRVLAAVAPLAAGNLPGRRGTAAARHPRAADIDHRKPSPQAAGACRDSPGDRARHGIRHGDRRD